MRLNTTEKEDGQLAPLETIEAGVYAGIAEEHAARLAVKIIDRLDKQVEELKAKLEASEKRWLT